MTTFKTSLLFPIFLVLAILSAPHCSKKPDVSQALAPMVAPGDTLPIQLKWTDVASQVIDENYTGFTGYTATLEGMMHIVDTVGDSLRMSFELTRFSLDTLRESGTLDADLANLTEKILQKVPANPWPLTRHFRDGDLFFAPVTVMHGIVQEVLTAEDYRVVQAGPADFEELAALYESIHFFPGEKPKGFKWESQAISKRQIEQTDTLTVSWELIRSNTKEMAFYGTTSHRIIKEAPVSVSDKPSLLYRYQYALNPVYRPETHWIKAGSLEIRAESSSLIRETDPDTGEQREISKPFAVRNLRITFIPLSSGNPK
jgi:hypothetical protein